MADCCNDKACEIEALRARQSSTLKIVLGINAVMFLVKDAMVYGFSLYVVARGERLKAVAALFKGGIMAAFGLFVLGQAIASFCSGGNVSVLFVAAGVWLTHSGWPDSLVGLALAALFLRSALSVLREAIAAFRATTANNS